MSYRNPHPLARGKSYYRGEPTPLPVEPDPDNKTTLVYVLDADHGVKVGITMGTIGQRLASFRLGAGIHVDVVRTYAFETRPDAWTAEQAAHRALADWRKAGEWFHCHPLEATAILDRLHADYRRLHEPKLAA